MSSIAAEENSFWKDGDLLIPNIPKYAELLLAHGYSFDSEKNVALLSSLMESESAGFSRGDLLKLYRVWSFLCRLERTGVAELPALVSLDAGQGGDHEDFGVHFRTGAPMFFAPHRNLLRRLCGWLETISQEAIESTSLPDENRNSDDDGSDKGLSSSPHDSVVSFQRQQRTPRSASSHSPHDSLATIVEQCVRLGEAERAAALALWHGDLDLCVHLLCAAVGFLRRCFGSATAGVTMMLSVPSDATDSERAEYADALELAAACVAGYPEHNPPTSNEGSTSRWRVTTQRMLIRLQRLALSPTHNRTQGVGYLQAICHFLLVNECASGRTRRSELYSAFLKAPHEAGALAVSDTLAFAATYLDGVALQQCLQALCTPHTPATTRVCPFTCLEAFCATGLSTCGQALLLRYLKQSGDAVTVALLAARCITEPGLFASQSLLPLTTSGSYPSLAQPPLAGGGRVPAAALSAVAASLSSLHQQRLQQREEVEKWRSKWAAATIQLLRLRLTETQRKTEVISRARLDLALARRLLALRQWQAAPVGGVGGALELSGQALLHQTLLTLLQTRTSVSLAIGDHSSVGQSLFGNTAATQSPADQSGVMRLSVQQREEAATFDATQQLAAAVLSMSLGEAPRRTDQVKPGLLTLDGHAGVCRVNLLCRQCRRPVGGSSTERDVTTNGASPNAGNRRGDGDAETVNEASLVDAAANDVAGVSDNEAMRVLLSLGQCSGCRAALPACFVCDLPLAMPRARRPVPLPGRQRRDAGREDLSVSLCQRCGHGGHPDCLRALRRYCQPLPREWQRYSDRRRSFRGLRARSRDADSDRDGASTVLDSPSDSDDGLSLAGEDLRSEIDTVRSGSSEDDTGGDLGSDGDAWLDSDDEDGSWASAADDSSTAGDGVSVGSRRARRPFRADEDDETDGRAGPAAAADDDYEDEDEEERLWPRPPLSSPPPAVTTGLSVTAAARPRDRKRSVSSAAAASHTSRLSTQPARRGRSDDPGPLLVPSRPRRVSTAYPLYLTRVY